jgi:hypothetical protein
LNKTPTTTERTDPMERFNALGRGAQIMLVGAVLLFIDLFLPWQDFDVGGLADEFGVDATFSGWRGFAGIVLGLLTIVLLAWIIVRLASVNIPLPVSTAMTAALLGTLILIFAIIKILTILGDEATIWAWIGLVLAIVVAVGAWQTVQEAGGVDTLRSEIPSTSASSGTATTSVPPAPPPPAAEPAPPATPEAAPSYEPPDAAPEAAPGDTEPRDREL